MKTKRKKKHGTFLPFYYTWATFFPTLFLLHLPSLLLRLSPSCCFAPSGHLCRPYLLLPVLLFSTLSTNFFYKYILPSFFLFFLSFFLPLILSLSSYLPSLLPPPPPPPLFAVWNLSTFMLPALAAPRVSRGQCRRLDWWLEGGKDGRGRIGPLLTKDLQCTLGPSLECVCVDVLPAVVLFSTDISLKIRIKEKRLAS